MTAVSVSADGLRVLAGTSAVSQYTHTHSGASQRGWDYLSCCTVQGSIGLLDAGSHSYSTLMRSHTAAVQSMSLQEGGGSGSSGGGGSGSSGGGSLVTCSHDHTIRVWDVDTGAQVDLLCVCISVLQCTIPPPPAPAVV